MNIPTDKEILELIYKKYKNDYLSYKNDKSIRKAKIFVPLNIEDISSDLKTEADIVFGRLYYHMDEKYGYKRSDGSNVNFFVLKIGEYKHCVNYPLMVSVLASLRAENKKFFVPVMISILSTLVAITTLSLKIGGIFR
ncbi:hypothetical protein R7Z80_17375 [Vibrio sp. 1733]|uniref:hypothetical protein n=1 Tax=unclassified Vibrio TaxID=2614977 RepID=UPI0029641B15|nr:MULTISPECIES: hypothetical protein [unclassified Vibrio]MDG2675966.1 hypothetical protein [Vibrio parahaemolyticus]MDW1906240.1 hypothetical protein [Vibrio sp. 705]MDW1948625.1 hypothetical protein [Vibrio sp. 812(2023)]MDW1992035.1 hypothetical protein [Vibrio sp. 780]MDW2187629.1 hypothetical protein [Vibrio sp. 1733]